MNKKEEKKVYDQNKTGAPCLNGFKKNRAQLLKSSIISLNLNKQQPFGIVIKFRTT